MGCQTLQQLCSSNCFTSEDQLKTLGQKLLVPETIVEHYIFNSKKRPSVAGVWLLMYWYRRVSDKSVAYNILRAALKEVKGPENQEEMTLEHCLAKVSRLK